MLQCTGASSLTPDLDPYYGTVIPGGDAIMSKQPTMRKIPNAAAASMQQRGLLLAPAMSSTPEDHPIGTKGGGGFVGHGSCDEKCTKSH